MKRIEVLDLCRSLCVFVMLVFHALYDLEGLGVLPAGLYNSPPMVVIERIFAGGFIMISGVCTRFSRSAVKRGFFVFGCGLAVSVVSLAAGAPVAFGALHLIGISMMLCGRGRKLIDALPVPGTLWACAALTAVSAALTSKVTVGVRWLFPLGFRAADFYSADYFPLLPWFFVFAAGAVLGKIVEARRDCGILAAHVNPALTFLGRHSLAIYLIHQPLLYIIFHLIFK